MDDSQNYTQDYQVADYYDHASEYAQPKSEYKEVYVNGTLLTIDSAGRVIDPRKLQEVKSCCLCL